MRGEGVPPLTFRSWRRAVALQALANQVFSFTFSIFFVPISAFFENRSSRGIVIKKSLVPITISFVDDVSQLQNQWISFRVVSLFSAWTFSIFIWAYCHANRNTKVQTSKSMVFLQGVVAFFRTEIFNFHLGVLPR